MSQLTRAVPRPGLRAPGSRFAQQLPRLPAQNCPLYCSEGLVCSDVLPLHCCETAGGTTNPKALTATSVVVTASMVRRVNKPLTGTAVVVTATAVRQVGKPLTATAVAVTATLRKQVGKPLIATAVAVTATLSALRAFLRTLTATSVVVTGTLSKQVGKTLAATTVALTGTIVRQVGKRFTGSSSVTATQVPTFISGGGVTNPKAMTATSVVATASMTATFIPAPTFGVSVQDFSPILAAV